MLAMSLPGLDDEDYSALDLLSGGNSNTGTHNTWFYWIMSKIIRLPFQLHLLIWSYALSLWLANLYLEGLSINSSHTLNYNWLAVTEDTVINIIFSEKKIGKKEKGRKI